VPLDWNAGVCVCGGKDRNGKRLRTARPTPERLVRTLHMDRRPLWVRALEARAREPRYDDPMAYEYGHGAP
jgi:hypothetical protein